MQGITTAGLPWAGELPNGPADTQDSGTGRPGHGQGGPASDASERRLAPLTAELALALIDQAHCNLVWKWDMVTDSIEWGPEIATWLGYPREEVQSTGRWWKDRVHPEDQERVLASLRAVLRTDGITWSDGYRLRRRDASYIAVFDRGFIVRDAGGRPLRLVSAMLEIPELWRLELALRRIEEQLQEARRRLEELERLAAVGQLTAFVIHQLNNPLTSLALLTKAIERRTADPGIRESLGRIDAQRRLMSDLLSDLEAFSSHRIAVGDSDLRGIVQTAIQEVLAFRRPPVSLQVDLGDKPAVIRGDPVQIREAVANVVKNALQATTEGPVEVRLEPREDAWAIVVSDSGPGIPPDILARIFEPMFTTKRPGEGTGLGLYFSKVLVAGHGGDILVQSEVGHGTTFTLLLPRSGEVS